ncbi:MAG TPA: hypothetical protein DGG95_09750, partial [Cytophagales bacterium]|nr:hypothetical protein [Cytophagales bacterium]
MRLALFFLFAFYFHFASFAQDSLLQKKSEEGLQRLDREDTIQGIGFRIDSLSKFKNYSLDSLQKNFKHKSDSLQKTYAAPVKKLDGALAQLNHQKDSLAKLNLSTASVTNKIDSLEKSKTQQLNELNSKISSLKSETLSKASSMQLPSDAQHELESFTQNIHGYSVPTNFFSLPSSDLPTGSLPSMPSANLPGNLSVPTVNMPSVSNLDPSLSKDINQLQSLKGKTSAEALELDAKNVASQSSELKGMFKDQAQVDKMEKELGALKNPKSADSIALAQLKPAINHFAGKEQELQSAMSQVSKYKEKYSSVKSLAELPKRAPNPLKGKPWYERTVPGVNYFVQNKSYALVDFNPYVGWRFNPHLTISLGWNERIGISHGEFRTNKYDRVYGVRASASYLWTHGITFKVAPEVMDAFVPTDGTRDVKHEATVWGLYAGIKKDFPIYKKIKGYSEVMYNFTQHGQNIYGDPVSFRFGIEGWLKKNPKKQKDPKMDSLLALGKAKGFWLTRGLTKWAAEYKKKKAVLKEYNDFLKKNFTGPEVRHIKNKTAFVGMGEKALYQSLG